MSKTLVIAEKPSVALDLSQVLAKRPGSGGSFAKEKDYFENESYVISSAIGHLVEQKLPMGPNGKSLPWKFDILPVIPDEFELQPVEGSKSRLNLLKRLMKRKDVGTIVNACDAGREGELIFNLIADHAGISGRNPKSGTKAKDVLRLWLQSMTASAIRKAFENLRPSEEYANLRDAAYARDEADWMVAFDSSR